MQKYKITLNGFKIGVIEADSYEKALNRAVYLHGPSVDIEEIL